MDAGVARETTFAGFQIVSVARWIEWFETIKLINYLIIRAK